MNVYGFPSSFCEIEEQGISPFYLCVCVIGELCHWLELNGICYISVSLNWNENYTASTYKWQNITPWTVSIFLHLKWPFLSVCSLWITYIRTNPNFLRKIIFYILINDIDPCFLNDKIRSILLIRMNFIYSYII